MKLYSTLLTCTLFSIAFSSNINADNNTPESTSTTENIATTSSISPADLASGKQLFERNCSTCHGHRGQRPAFGRSAIINTLSTEQIVKALELRKAGIIKGPGNPAKSRLNEEQMKWVAEYIQTLKK